MDAQGTGVLIGARVPEQLLPLDRCQPSTPSRYTSRLGTSVVDQVALQTRSEPLSPELN